MRIERNDGVFDTRDAASAPQFLLQGIAGTGGARPR